MVCIPDPTNRNLITQLALVYRCTKLVDSLGIKIKPTIQRVVNGNAQPVQVSVRFVTPDLTLSCSLALKIFLIQTQTSVRACVLWVCVYHAFKLNDFVQDMGSIFSELSRMVRMFAKIAVLPTFAVHRRKKIRIFSFCSSGTVSA